MAYDVFGNGKTALKVSAARGVAGETIATAASLNPGASFATSTAINVTDGAGGPKDNIAECNFANPARQRRVRSVADADVRQRDSVTQQDPATLNGWNKRPWNWEFSAGVQQQVSPRLSAGITYYRRINGGFLVTDNTATTASDYSQYSLTVPTDSRLATSGQTLTYYDVNPVLKSGASGLTTTNLTTFASNYGNQYQHWNGVDITGTSRLAAGVTANGGVTFGRKMFDNCDLVQAAGTPDDAAGGSQPVADVPLRERLGAAVQAARVVHPALAEHPHQRQHPEPARSGPSGVRALHAGAGHVGARSRGDVAGNKSALVIEPAIPLSSASGSGTGTPCLAALRRSSESARPSVQQDLQVRLEEHNRRELRHLQRVELGRRALGAGGVLRHQRRRVAVADDRHAGTHHQVRRPVGLLARRARRQNEAHEDRAGTGWTGRIGWKERRCSFRPAVPAHPAFPAFFVFFSPLVAVRRRPRRQFRHLPTGSPTAPTRPASTSRT